MEFTKEEIKKKIIKDSTFELSSMEVSPDIFLVLSLSTLGIIYYAIITFMALIVMIFYQEHFFTLRDSLFKLIEPMFMFMFIATVMVIIAELENRIQ